MNPLHRRTRQRVAAMLLACTVGGLTAAHAADVEYTLQGLGGDRWQYDYTLVNPDASLVFDEITVYFSLPAVQSIESFTVPAGWDGVSVQPDSGIPADGFFDALHTSGPVPAGARISGFSVVFDVAPGTVPGSQPFELALSNGPGGFAVVASGATTAVPEPGAFALMASGTAALAFLARRRRGEGVTARRATTAGVRP